MIITQEQIAFIARDIEIRGITMPHLADDLLDHICCSIESAPSDDFNDTYLSTLEKFGSKGLEKIQKQTESLINKNHTIMKGTMYFLGYLALSLITTGLLFKIQHWPSAAIILTLGIAILNFGFLPMYFYGKFKHTTE